MSKPTDMPGSDIHTLQKLLSDVAHVKKDNTWLKKLCKKGREECEKRSRGKDNNQAENLLTF